MRFKTLAVLAGAYKGKAAQQAATLTHTFDSIEDRVLCGRVKVESLADDNASDVRARPTCVVCLARDPRVWGVPARQRNLSF